MLEALIVLQTIGLLVGLPLLALYIKERIKNVARESTERALADYRHQHDQALANLQAQHQRQLEEFSLFRRKRHEIYAELYRRVRMASDGYASMTGLSMGTNFSKYTALQAREYFERHKVPNSLTSPILVAFEKGDSSTATQLLDDLEHRLKHHKAARAFTRAKNFEALNDLYLSDEMRLLMDRVRNAIAVVTVTFDDDGSRDSKQYEKSQKMEATVQELYRAMRSELQH